ncbi:MAG: hypothetical protein ACXABY_01215 [Candidatus Thorarchaeota archaeon]|jgi:chromosome segregation ATPase
MDDCCGRGELPKANAELTRLRNKLAQEEEVTESYRERFITQEHQIDELRADLAERTRERDEARALARGEPGAYRAGYSDAEAEAQRRIAELEADLKEYGSEYVDKLQQDVDERNVLIANLKGDIKAMQDDAEGRERVMGEHREPIATATWDGLNAALIAAEARQRDWESARQAEKERGDRLEAELAERTRETERLRVQLDQQQGERLEALGGAGIPERAVAAAVGDRFAEELITLRAEREDLIPSKTPITAKWHVAIRCSCWPRRTRLAWTSARRWKPA